MTNYPVEPTDKALVDAGEAYFWINKQSEVVRFAGTKG